MLVAPTTFVIGAGASVEFGLPDGASLATSICKDLNIRFDAGRLSSGDAQIAEELRRGSSNRAGQGGAPAWQAACWRICAGLPLANSIDNYLANHSEDQEMQRAGRIAIIKNILKAESFSKLRPVENTGFVQTETRHTWIHRLFLFLQEGRAKVDVDRFFENCRFIIFNYDRCIERFFYQSLARHYGIPAEKAHELVAAAEMIHVYGSVGELPRQGVAAEDSVEFGNADVALSALAPRIRTYADPSPESETKRIEEYLSGAKLIVFLGFAFHESNVALLRPSQHRPPAVPAILATAYNRSKYDAERIAHKLNSQLRYAVVGGHPIVDRSASCATLLDDYSTAFVG